MDRIRVLVVEDNTEMCDIFENYLPLTAELELCGVAKDGEEGLRKIFELKPDVVLLDIIMPKLDGISVLEKLQTNPPEKMPCIIVMSAVGQERFTARALELGASYYFIKPLSLEDICRRISFIIAPASACNVPAHDIEGMISQEVIELGVPTNILGFKYIIEAVKLLIRGKMSYPISKQIYAQIAQNNRTTVECVESALRKTISRIYESQSQKIQALTHEEKKPSNAQFLTALAENIKQKRRLSYV